MRVVALLLATVLGTVPGIAQETDAPDGIDTTETSFTVADEDEAPPQRLGLDLEAVFAADEPDGVFDAASVLRVRSERDYRAIFWNDPMGRLRYDMAAQQAMLGREGLVHGGHMVGIGLGNAVIGDGSRSGIGMLLDGRAWSEMTGAERARAGFDVALTAGILWALLDGLN